MGLSFSTHSVHRILIKVYQCSLIKQTTRGSTWDLVILNHYDLRPSENRQNTGYIFLIKYMKCIEIEGRINISLVFGILKIVVNFIRVTYTLYVDLIGILLRSFGK